MKSVMKVLVTQLCSTLCDPMDCSPPGSSVYGILQARILEWVAIPSRGDLSQPGTESGLLHCSRFFTVWATRKAPNKNKYICVHFFFHLLSLLFKLGSFYCVIFQFTDSFLQPLHSAVEPNPWAFFIWLVGCFGGCFVCVCGGRGVSYCIFKFLNFQISLLRLFFCWDFCFKHFCHCSWKPFF